jgi:hypothetical protein
MEGDWGREPIQCERDLYNLRRIRYSIEYLSESYRNGSIESLDNAIEIFENILTSQKFNTGKEYITKELVSRGIPYPKRVKKFDNHGCLNANTDDEKSATNSVDKDVVEEFVRLFNRLLTGGTQDDDTMESMNEEESENV